MIPTWIGMLILLIGAFLLVRGSVMAMLGLVLASLLLGGSSAIDLPALGGSTITPAYMALGLLALRILLAPGAFGAIALAARQNWPMIIFCLYGALTALLLPRVFEGAMQVIPMRLLDSGNIFATAPLGASSQNITSAVYLVGALIACLAGAIVARQRGAPRAVLNGLVWLTWGHFGLGLLALVLTSLGQTQIMDLIRNASYAQLNQEYQGFIRITGFFPEASGFASFGFILLVFCLEAWLRDVAPGRTGPAALCMGLMLFLSTSSTAYLGLGAYALILAVRWLLIPGAVTGRKALGIGMFGFIAVLGALILAVAIPALLAAVVDMVQHMTVDKADSQSGVERRVWAEQGIAAFKVSYGLGVGAGSFRSSSLFTAIMGAMGVVGVTTFLIYLWRFVQPLRQSTYGAVQGPGSAEFNLGGACAMAAALSLVAAFVTAPGPIPEMLFCLLAGMALSFRSPGRQPVAAAVPQARPVRRPASAPLGPEAGVARQGGARWHH